MTEQNGAKRSIEYRKPTTLSELEAENKDLRALAHDMLLSLEWTLRGNSIHVEQLLAYKRMARKLGVKE